MHQNLLNAEFASVEYLNAGNRNAYVRRVIQALTKESRQVPGCFCCISACRKVHFMD